MPEITPSIVAQEVAMRDPLEVVPPPSIEDGPPYGIQLDQLASFARTALDDPDGLPEGVDVQRFDLNRIDTNASAQKAIRYAIDRLDDIIDVLNPAIESRVTMARALRVLGRHVAEIQGLCKAMADDAEPEDANAYASADYAVELALDRVDEAIQALEGTDTDEFEGDDDEA